MRRTQLIGTFVLALMLAMAGVSALRAEDASPGGSAALAEKRADGVRLDGLQIPAAISPSKTFWLEAIVARPDDGEPHPLALLNHGSPRDSDDRTTMSPYRMWAQAMAFARRGFVAVAFLRRGYGHSQGRPAEGYGSGLPDFLFGLKAEGSKVLHLSSPSDGSCFDGPLEAVSLHRL